MSADPEQFDRRLMREAFDLFEQHEQMREVVCQYGARAEQQLAASPRVRWEPGRETFAGPVSRRSFAVLGASWCHFEVCGVTSVSMKHVP